MKTDTPGEETFLYLSGLRVERQIRLADGVDLLPATCSPSPDDIIAVSKSEIDLGVAALFLRSVASQVRVRAASPKDLAVLAWNTDWDWVLLSAFCDCDVVCNLECDTRAEDFSSRSTLRVTNYHLRALTLGEPRPMTPDEASWFEESIGSLRQLLDDEPRYRTAVHCLATYRWHSLPRVQLAVLWAGIEGLFGVDSELSFRLALYAARFLEPDDAERRTEIFEAVKRLYKQRSAAVHGSRLKGDPQGGVVESANLLRRILRQCAAEADMPKTETLAP